MQFDPENKIVKLCAEGMNLEGEKAMQLFQQAWEEANNNFEKFIAAHYIARHQTSVLEKLKWDRTSLDLALSVKDKIIKTAYPSLYLNIAKCYEDLNELDNANKNYQLALSFAKSLPDDGYSNMIKSGIENGIKRITE